MTQIRLNVTHTHGGVAYPKGALIDVDEHTALWLAHCHIGVPLAPDAPTAKLEPAATPIAPPPAAPAVKVRTAKLSKEQ